MRVIRTAENEDVKIKSPPCTVVVSSKDEVVADTSSTKRLSEFESDSLEGKYIMKLERRLGCLENLIPQYHSRFEEDAIFKQKLQEKIQQLIEEGEIFKQKMEEKIQQLESKLDEKDHYKEDVQKTAKQAAKSGELAQPREKKETEMNLQYHSQLKGMAEMKAAGQDLSRLKEMDSGSEKMERKVAGPGSHLGESDYSKENMEETAIAEIHPPLVKETYHQKANTEKEIQDAKKKSDERFKIIEREVEEHALQLDGREEKREKTVAQFHSQVEEKDHQMENLEREIQGAKKLFKEIGKRVEGIEKKVAEHALQLDKISSSMKTIEKTNTQFYSQLVKETIRQREKMEKELKDLKELMKGISQRTEEVEKNETDHGFRLEEIDSRVERIMKTAIDRFHLQLEESRRFLEEKLKKEMRDLGDEVKNQSAFLFTHQENMALLRRALGDLNVRFQREVNKLNRRVDILFARQIIDGPIVPTRLG
ncbi:coiled-coil domain-containing protein 18-like [Stylophora pistillata]|nr:coiled-coil domain-containing protein 18-like [Stylophora pistillata]